MLASGFDFHPLILKGKLAILIVQPERKQLGVKRTEGNILLNLGEVYTLVHQKHKTCCKFLGDKQTGWKTRSTIVVSTQNHTNAKTNE